MSRNPEIDTSKLQDGNLMKILVATDCHLGYEETDPIIGEDSFVTFEEVLTKALDEEVDFILLGGDLFHHNNPSQKTMNKCIELLRQYTFGNQEIKFHLVSRAAEVFSHCFSQTANFLDENINVSIPVFSIHGNHDDPSGFGQHSSLDTLSSAGLINYFGKWTDLSEIHVKPIVLRKGQTFLALYGLSHIKDDRLCRLFIENKVIFHEPEVMTDKCIRVLVLHQNRVERGPKRYVAESFLPSFFDMVIWGHEHDCEIDPSWNMEKEFHVSQPGSTVATSLCEGEAKPKHIGVLHLWKDFLKLFPIKLNTVRPFIWKSINLSDIEIPLDLRREVKSEKIMSHCSAEVEEMIKEAKSFVTGHPKQPTLPLIRLRCEFTDESQLFNIVKFGQRFLNRVATPNLEIIRLKKITDSKKKREQSDRAELLSNLKRLYSNNMEENLNFSECVNRIVNDYFSQHPESKMSVLNVAEMATAVEKFIDKDETDIINLTVDRKLKKIMNRLASHTFEDADEIVLELERMRDEEEAGKSEKEKELDAELGSRIGTEKRPTTIEESDSGTDEYDLADDVNPPPAKGIKRPYRSETAKGSDSSDNEIRIVQSESDSDQSEKNPSTYGRGRGETRGRGKGRGRGRGTSKKSNSAAELKSVKKSPASHLRGQTRKPLNFNNSIVYEDDDSD